MEQKTHVSTQTYGTVAYMPPELLSSSRLTKAVRPVQSSISCQSYLQHVCRGATPLSLLGVIHPVRGAEIPQPLLWDAYWAILHSALSADAAMQHQVRSQIVEVLELLAQADTYSFGMLMWEITTSTMPWERMTVGQVFFAVVQEDSRPLVPQELPQGYRDLMTVWMYRSLDKAPQSSETQCLGHTGLAFLSVKPQGRPGHVRVGCLERRRHSSSSR